MRDRKAHSIWRVLRLGIGLLGVLTPELGGAQQLQARPSSELASETRERIEVHLVGVVTAVHQLESLIPEWFMLEGLTVELKRHHSLQPQDILTNTPGNTSVRIWVSLIEEHQARLYFSDSTGTRFLLRDVPLPSGLDEVGREQLVHVLLASADAFASARVSTSKAEVERSFEATTPSSKPKRPAPHWVLDGKVTLASSARRATEAQFRPRIGALFQTAVQSTDALRWGPGLLLGARRSTDDSSYALTAKVVYSYVGDESSGPVVLSSKILSFRLTLARDFSVSQRFRWGVEVGGGLDRVQFVPRVTPNAAFTAREAGKDVRPVTTAALSYAVIFDDWQLTMLAGTSLSLVAVRYDIALDGQRFTQVRPWLVQPSASLEASWH